MFAREEHHAPQQGAADQQPEHDQRERLETGVDADLDEQVAAAPEEAEETEDQPVDFRPAPAARRIRHRCTALM